MSYWISTTQRGQVPAGAQLATFNLETYQLWLWPGGIGAGPCLVLSVADWNALRDSAEAALAQARRDVSPPK